MDGIRLQNMNKELMRKFKILAKDNGKTTSRYLKSVINEICKEIEHVDLENIEWEKSSVQNISLSPSKIALINDVSTKIGITRDQYLRIKLFEHIEKQPELIKKLF